MKPLIAASLLLMVIIAGCHGNTEKTREQTGIKDSKTEEILDTILLRQTIKHYLENSDQNPSPEGKIFASYHVLGINSNHDTINAFIWAYIMDYSPGISGPTENTGLSLPVKITLLRSNEKFHVHETEYPEEGENYAESVRDIFPAQFHEWIWGSEKYETIQLLKEDVLEEATAYYEQATESPDRKRVADSTIQEGPRMEVTIIVPEDLPGYEAAMTRYVQTGEGSDPADTFNFIKKTITTSGTSEPEKTCAQLAADQIKIGGGPERATIIHFKIHQNTSYIVFDINVDGWLGSSVAIAKLRPLVEKTLLNFRGIDKVVFDYAPE
ncbi:MAG: hypothetical protein U9N72_09850 [Bacteroidota bacterium]|nr:hypothetical protein [Bacteroidota bacterium]